MRIMPLISLVLIVSLGNPVGPALADTVYKWVDETGTVHYGPRPPAGVDAEEMTVNPQSPRPPALPDGEPADGTAQVEAEQKSYAQQRREERAERRERLAREQARLETECEAMRKQLAATEPYTRVIVETADGGTRRMDDEERLRLVNEAKSFLEKNCR